MINWQSIQDVLFALVKGDIEAFALQHQGKVFYGFFLDCNAYYGDVLPCFNTPEALRKQAETFKYSLSTITGTEMSDFYADKYADKSIPEIEEELRWECGGWEYLQINRWEIWRTEWDSFFKRIEPARGNEDLFCEQFMAMACRLLFQIEESGLLALVDRSSDFATMVADHDERLEDARLRLDAARKLAKA